MNIAAMALGYLAQDKVKPKPIVKAVTTNAREKGVKPATAERLEKLESLVTYDPQKVSDVYKQINLNGAKGNLQHQRVRDDVKILVKLGRVRTIRFDKSTYVMSLDNKQPYCSSTLQQRLLKFMDGNHERSEMAKALGCHVTSVNSTVKIMLREGIIEQTKKKANSKLYELAKAVGIIEP